MNCDCVQLKQLCDHITSCNQSQDSISPTSPKLAADLVSKMASNYEEALDMLASLEKEQTEVCCHCFKLLHYLSSLFRCFCFFFLSFFRTERLYQNCKLMLLNWDNFGNLFVSVEFNALRFVL